MAEGVNATAAALLGLLHESPMTGGQLMAAAERRLGPYWSMTRSQVYRELPVLADLGFVRLGKPGPRSSQPYAITASGNEVRLGAGVEKVHREGNKVVAVTVATESGPERVEADNFISHGSGGGGYGGRVGEGEASVLRAN